MLRQRLRQYRDLIQLILSFTLAAVAAVDMIGRPARLVMVVTLFAGALGVGVTVGMLVEHRRAARLNA